MRAFGGVNEDGLSPLCFCQPEKKLVQALRTYVTCNVWNMRRVCSLLLSTRSTRYNRSQLQQAQAALFAFEETSSREQKKPRSIRHMVLNYPLWVCTLALNFSRQNKTIRQYSDPSTPLPWHPGVAETGCHLQCSPADLLRPDTFR